MKNSLLTIAIVAIVLLSNPNIAFGQTLTPADQALADRMALGLDLRSLQESCAEAQRERDRVLAEVTRLDAERDRLEGEASKLALRLAESDDSDEIDELREKFQGQIARILALETEAATYKAKAERLEAENVDLREQIADLTEENTDLQTQLDQAYSIASEESVELEQDQGTYSNPGIQNASMPSLDPGVFTTTGYCGYMPARPSPIDHPEVRASQAGFVTFENVSGDYVFLRVPGIRAWDNKGEHITSGEVLVAPYVSCHFPVEDMSPRMVLTPAWESVSGASTYEWSGRGWVSVQRTAGSCNIQEYVGADSKYEYGPYSCRQKR